MIERLREWNRRGEIHHYVGLFLAALGVGASGHSLIFVPGEPVAPLAFYFIALGIAIMAAGSATQCQSFTVLSRELSDAAEAALAQAIIIMCAGTEDQKRQVLQKLEELVARYQEHNPMAAPVSETKH